MLLENVQVADTTWQRLRGLMFRRSLAAGEGLLIPECSSVHTCFMRFPLDLAYLDAAGAVVKLVHALRPWRVSWCRGAQSVLEMTAGTSRTLGLEVGDRVEFVAPT
jgi:uncharacterized membrane protein (UPF0127 family)